jgi:6,7-dimethyl-8-ribityllumazine synthase
MLKKLKRTTQELRDARVAIVASQYNARYVNGLLRGAQRELRRAGVKHARVVRVPGAFEIPAVAAWLAHHTLPRPEAIICLGVILRGETTHAEFIGAAVTHALARLQVEKALPFIHEVLLLEDAGQAQARCLGMKYNRGAEAAQTALAMVRVMRWLGASGAPTE